jgi:hypothetical protein
MTHFQSFNLFSNKNMGKAIVYTGDVLEDVDTQTIFEITEDPGDEVYQLGYGASVIHLVNEDRHITITGSSRLINESFRELVIDEEEEPVVEEIKPTIIVEERVVVGQQGPEGPQGLPGIPGRDGKNGQDGLDGKDGKDGRDGKDGEPGPAGPQGEKGDPGPQGEQGPKGDEGDRGPEGSIGIQGPKGDKGDRGDQGVQGEKGDPGVKGEKGDKGDRGEKGDAGPQGKQGKPGAKGAKGDKGDRGSDGSVGPQGPQGERGEKGDKGDPGVVQVSGPLRYDTSSRTLSVSEEWINSLGNIVKGGAVVGGGGDLLGIKRNGNVVPFGNVVRYIDFRGTGITISSDGVNGIVEISAGGGASVTDVLKTVGGDNIMYQFLDMNNNDIYGARIDGGTF